MNKTFDGKILGCDREAERLEREGRRERDG